MRMHSWRRPFLALLLAPALTFAAPVGTGTPATPAKPAHVAKPDVRSASVIVLDAVDSSVLYSRQAQRPVPIASITKLMTALVVLDAGQPLDELIELTVADRRLERSSGLAPGRRQPDQPRRPAAPGADVFRELRRARRRRGPIPAACRRASRQ